MELTLDKIKHKITDEKPCEVTFSVQIPSDIVNHKKEKISGEFQKVAQLPGFRAGKAPLDLVKLNYSEKIKNETMEQLLRDSIPHILKQKEIAPLTHPVIKKVEYTKENALSFSLVVERSPKFKVKDYNKIPVSRKIRTVKPADVDKELATLQERNSQLEPSAAAKAEKTHFVAIDYAGYLGEELQSDLIEENQLINLSSSQSIEGFAEGILGMAAGESKDITVQFPKEYPKEKLAGKPVKFKITLREIKNKIVPPLDDEFAKDFGLASLQELKSKIEESLKESAKRTQEADVEKQILEHLLKENPIPLPESLVSMQLDNLLHRALQQVRVPENKVEETLKTMREKYRPEAERQVRISYLLGGIAQQEKIRAGEEDLQAELAKSSASNAGKEEAVKKYFEEHREAVLNHLTEDKVMNFIKEHAKMKDIIEP